MDRCELLQELLILQSQCSASKDALIEGLSTALMAVLDNPTPARCECARKILDHVFSEGY